MQQTLGKWVLGDQHPLRCGSRLLSNQAGEASLSTVKSWMTRLCSMLALPARRVFPLRPWPWEGSRRLL